MPLPKPRDDESRAEFVERCMSDPVMRDDFEESDQRLAVCSTQWDESKMIDNDTLLKAVQARQRKRTEFGYGIMTADRYVATLRDDIGIEACYRFAATKRASFDDMLRKAASTLVYSNDEMELEEIYGEKLKLPKDLELPKNTLMVFRHTLTTSRKDRDGDILRSDGAEVDPRMLLLWQHAHTLPIGKMLREFKKTKSRLELISAIVDVNEMAHDAAVMVENAMARFSHGFRALAYEPIKGKDSEEEGFDITQFEIMEESMVSVPANVDAEAGEVLLSLVEDGKLTSGVMKEHAKTVKAGRNVSVPGVEIKYTNTVGDWTRELSCGSLADLKAASDAGLLGDKKNEDQPGDRTGEGGERRDRGGSSKEAAKDEGEGAEKEPGDKEGLLKFYGDLSGSFEWINSRLRSKSKRYLMLSEVSVGEDDWVCLVATYPDHAIIRHETQIGDEIYYSAKWEMAGKEPEYVGEPEEVEVKVEVSKSRRKEIEKAMAYVLTNADSKQRNTMIESLQALEKVEERSKRTKRFNDLKSR